MQTPTSFNSGFAITTSDTVDLAPWSATNTLTTGVYVGGAGIVVAVFQDGTAVNFTAVAGATLPLAVRRINATTTSATLLVALYAK